MMNRQLKAVYFDGTLSLPHQVVLEYGENLPYVQFTLADGTCHQWLLSSLRFSRYDHTVELRNVNLPDAELIVESEEFAERFYQIMLEHSRVDVSTRLTNLGVKQLFILTLALLAAIVLGYIYVLPVVSEKAVDFLPQTIDNEIGTLYVESVSPTWSVDTAKTRSLEEFAKELNLKNRKQLRFVVVRSEVVNAYAIPNGQIVVHTAILDRMTHPEELAALLGHEAAHINHRHSLKMLSRSLAGYMITSLLLGDLSGVAAVIADNADMIQSLSYSRKFEQEADEEGLKILIENQLDPQGMVYLFEMLEKESGRAIPVILSSHPLTEQRLNYVRDWIENSDYEITPNPRIKELFAQLKN